MKKFYLTSIEKRKENNSKMATNYRKRVENFVISMMEQPIVVTDYKSPSVKPIRDEDIKKNLAEA